MHALKMYSLSCSNVVILKPGSLRLRMALRVVLYRERLESCLHLTKFSASGVDLIRKNKS